MVDDRLDVLEQRLRTIYPATFDIDRVEADLVKKPVQPVEYHPVGYDDRVEDVRVLEPDPVSLRFCTTVGPEERRRGQ